MYQAFLFRRKPGDEATVLHASHARSRNARAQKNAFAGGRCVLGEGGGTKSTTTIYSQLLVQML